MPKNQGIGGTWGIFENNQITNDPADGTKLSIPTDWFFVIAYEVDYDKAYSSEIEFKSWVSEYTSSDEYSIRTRWQPTGTEYISPEEKKRREVEK